MCFDIHCAVADKFDQRIEGGELRDEKAVGDGDNGGAASPDKLFSLSGGESKAQEPKDGDDGDDDDGGASPIARSDTSSPAKGGKKSGAASQSAVTFVLKPSISVMSSQDDSGKASSGNVFSPGPAAGSGRRRKK